MISSTRLGAEWTPEVTPLESMDGDTWDKRVEAGEWSVPVPLLSFLPITIFLHVSRYIKNKDSDRSGAQLCLIESIRLIACRFPILNNTHTELFFHIPEMLSTMFSKWIGLIAWRVYVNFIPSSDTSDSLSLKPHNLQMRSSWHASPDDS